MKVTLNWLKQYVDFDWSPEQLAERLTMLGVEVEGVERLGGRFDGIVVAQVLSKDKHPNADKLALLRVHDGQGERQIVCGAHNYKPGDKVPLILPGSTLPAKGNEPPLTIKVGKIRGVESHGMLCSPQELGLPDKVEGILVLNEEAKVGRPFGEYLGLGGSDVVYDLEITPNRPDLNSVIGIAREIAALTRTPLKLPEAAVAEAGPPVGQFVEVDIRDAQLCPRYTARLVRGARIAPSPDWLRSALEKIGIRSINNVVDVTNYVMMETGQPLHAFDYRLLARAAGKDRPAIVVRRADAGEKFVTLDGQERSLTTDMLLIADERRAVALAGVMGGQNSEIGSDTTDILIESAYFKPQSIRATSKRLELRTESSYRFERGGDVGICEWASRRAARLILETAGGELAAGVVDAYPEPVEPKAIALRHAKVNDLLGLALTPEQIEDYLVQLELKTVARKPRPVGAEPAAPEPVHFRIPTFRVDLKREIDLIEEVARLYGVDRIPSTPPRGAIGSNAFDAVQDALAEARRILTAMGLNEAQGQTLISGAGAAFIGARNTVALANPLSSDMDVLRPSLVPGLLDILRHNLSHKNYSVGLFEIGRVFAADPMSEQRRVALALTGQRDPVFWTGAERDAAFDVFDLKGAVEEFLEQFGVRGVTYVRRPESPPLFLESATVHLGKFQIGELGQLHPQIARRYDLRDAAFIAELDLDQLLARRNTGKSFRQLPSLPPVRRDVAMIVAEAVTHEAVLQVVRQAKPAHLETVELFDVFRGKNVPADHKSMAYAFTYRSPERTLTDAEVNATHEKVVEQLRQKLQAAVRES